MTPYEDIIFNQMQENKRLSIMPPFDPEKMGGAAKTYPEHDCWNYTQAHNIPCQDCLSGSGLCLKHKVSTCTGCSGVDKCNYCIEIIKNKPQKGQDTIYFHQHNWSIDKFAGFIKTGVEGVYIICRGGGEVRLMEVNKPIPTP